MKNSITLRPYQEDAVEQGLWAARKFKDNSLIVAPVGSGKSLIVANIADRLANDILILQPSREILQQSLEKLSLYVDSSEIGVYSASFKRKDIRKYNFATIQSVYQKPELFNHIPLVLCDEAHTINPRNKKGMFSSFLRDIGNPITLGLTATPFRNVVGTTNVGGFITHGTILKLVNRMNPRFWNRIAYNMNHNELVEQGYLTRMKYYPRTIIPQSRIPMNASRSDFDLDAYAQMVLPEEGNIITSINGARKQRNSVLVFCSSVEQSKRLAQVITRAACVTGTTPNKERQEIITNFKNGNIDVVFNVGTMTTGFDHPSLDCIYMIRPTRSLSLYHQMVGRGTRLAPGKEDCQVLDYAGNFDTMGAIEDIRLEKEKLWELYAGGTKAHGREIFSWTKG